MLTKKFMLQFGIALGPITVVLLDTLFVGPDSSNGLVNAMRGSGATASFGLIVALFVGHWFHPVDGLKPGFGLLKSPWNYVVFGPITIVMVVLCLTVIPTASISDWFPMLMVFLGFALGAIFWPV